MSLQLHFVETNYLNMSGITVDLGREKILQDNRKKLIEHKEISSRLKGSKSHIILDMNFKYV